MSPEFLLLYFVGFGFVLILLWAAAATYAVDGDARRLRRSAVLFTIIGVTHPVGLLCAWDLWRQTREVT